MPSFLADLGTAFILGLLTPLTAVCVLPLYPGFLAFLTHKLQGREGDRKLVFLFGVVVVLGVISFMTLMGILFSFILEVSLTKVIGIVSPLAFGLLSIIALLLIFDVDFARFIPKMNVKTTANNPLLSALLFGFFFGAIVIPCQPAFIAALFAKALGTAKVATNILQFVSFGLGLGFPLLVFSALSSSASQKIIGFFTSHKTTINRTAGVLMLGLSLYFLIFDFRIFG